MSYHQLTEGDSRSNQPYAVEFLRYDVPHDSVSLMSLPLEILEAICTFCDVDGLRALMFTSSSLRPIAGSVFVQDVPYLRSYEVLQAFCHFIINNQLGGCIKHFRLGYHLSDREPYLPSDCENTLCEVLDACLGLKRLTIDVRVLVLFPKLREWLSRSSLSFCLHLIFVDPAVKLDGTIINPTNVELFFSDTHTNIAGTCADVLLGSARTLERLSILAYPSAYSDRSWIRLYQMSWVSLKSLTCTWDILYLFTAHPCPSLRQIVISPGLCFATSSFDLWILDQLRAKGSPLTSLTLPITTPRRNSVQLDTKQILSRLFRHRITPSFLSLCFQTNACPMDLVDGATEGGIVADDEQVESLKSAVSRGDWNAPSLRCLLLSFYIETALDIESQMLKLQWSKRFPNLEYLAIRLSAKQTWWRHDKGGGFHVISESEGKLAGDSFDWEGVR